MKYLLIGICLCLASCSQQTEDMKHYTLANDAIDSIVKIHYDLKTYAGHNKMKMWTQPYFALVAKRYAYVKIYEIEKYKIDAEKLYDSLNRRFEAVCGPDAEVYFPQPVVFSISDSIVKKYKIKYTDLP